jgi:hypothetical protein
MRNCFDELRVDLVNMGYKATIATRKALHGILAYFICFWPV